MCDISKNSKVEIPAKKNMFFFSKRGRLTDRWGMYEMTVICLDGSKNAFVVCRSFYEMVYEMRERSTEIKSGRRDRIFIGK